MQRQPDFFLSAAGESDNLSEVRACWIEKRLRDKIRDDYLLVRIDPPLIGQSYGLGATDITHLILATRHKGFPLVPVSTWSSHVSVLRPLNDKVFSQTTFGPEDIEPITLGMIWQRYEDIPAEVRDYVQ